MGISEDHRNIYADIYARKSAASIGSMLDFAVYSLHMNAEVFFGLFITSGLADLIESKDIRILAGRSGIELAYDVMTRSGLPYERVNPRFTSSTSKEYIAGAALAGVRNDTGLSFDDIISCIALQDILSAADDHLREVRKKLAEEWPPSGTSDSPDARRLRDEGSIKAIEEFIRDNINKNKASLRGETRLKHFRTLSGLSQARLAGESGIPVRTIQQYEQRQKDINKAGFGSVLKLSRALGIRPEDLIER